MLTATPFCRDRSPFRPLLRLLCATLVLTLCSTAPLGAAEPPVERPHEHVHRHPAPPPADDNSIGLDERLGARIPLDLAFRDETGQSVTLKELIDGPTLILPVYYSCTNVCNFLQGGLARTLPALKLDAGRQYRVLSISFDETEGPELAARYRKTYYDAIGAPFPAGGWRFLTGDAASIHAFTSAIGYRFRREGRDFVHPVASVVVATDGTIVRYLHGTNFLPKDLTLALIEAGEGRVGPTIRKVVEFCFSYDPAQKTYVFNLLRVSATAVIATVFALFLALLLAGRKKRPPKDLP